MTELEFVLDTNIDYLIKNHLTTITDIKLRKKDLIRSPELLSVSPATDYSCLDGYFTYGFYVNVKIPGIDLWTSISSIMKLNNRVPIFDFSFDGERIVYTDNFTALPDPIRLRDVYNFVLERRQELLPDLLLVTDYFEEAGSIEVVMEIFKNEFPGRRLRRLDLSYYFTKFVNVFSRCIVKPDNLYELIDKFREVELGKMEMNFEEYD